jgi:hypothetical protein
VDATLCAVVCHHGLSLFCCAEGRLQGHCCSNTDSIENNDPMACWQAFETDRGFSHCQYL